MFQVQTGCYIQFQVYVGESGILELSGTVIGRNSSGQLIVQTANHTYYIWNDYVTAVY